MDIKKLTQEVLLKNMTPEQQLAVLDSVTASVKEAKAVQKQKIAENVDLVLQALKRIEADMLKRVEGTAKTVEDRVKTIKDGKDGKDGVNGKDGKDGKDGKAGLDGHNGRDGLNGKAGERGQDGVGVQNAHIDFDGSLIISLTNGQELNVGEVVPFDIAEKIRVIGNGGGTSQFVLDTLASLQTQINNFGGGLSYKGTWNASTNTPTLTSGSGTNGWYYVVSTAGSTNLDGVTDWQSGDWLLFNGTTWQKIDQSWAQAGANSDITSLSGITGGISTVDYITFDVNPSTTPSTPGTLYWDTADGNQTLSLVMAGGTATQQIGEEQYFRIKASSAITDGQVVMFTGTVGASGALTGAPATGLTASTASYVMGIATQSIANNGWGYITSFGLVRQLNTSAWPAGTILYYDPTVAGGLTSTVPAAPNAKVQVCAVVYQHATNGSLFVRPAFGGTLGQYEGDVGLTSLATGDVLVRNAGNTVWENKAQSTLSVGTAASVPYSGLTGTVPTWNQNTTGKAANVSGTVAIANGGTGATTAAGALSALGAYAASNPSNYATQAYVDQYIQGIDAKGACRVASTGNVVAITGLLTIDGQTLVVGDRVLLKDQTTASQNGIYVVSALAWTRATDLDTWPEAPGAFTFIEQGTVNAGSGWVTTVTPGGTIGTTAMPWTQFSGVGTYTAGTGLTLTGSQFALDNTTVASGSYINANITVDAQGRLTSASNGSSSSFSAGTRLLFAQTTAPTGWTKDTVNYNNHALRVVTGTAGTGGTVDFTSAFASQGVTGSLSSTTATNQSTTAGGSVSVSLSVAGSVSATTLVESQIPSHIHGVPGNTSNSSGSPNRILSNTNSTPNVTNNTNATGGSGSHTHGYTASTYSGSFTGTGHTHTQDAHSHTFTGTSINLAVKYLDVITATKD